MSAEGLRIDIRRGKILDILMSEGKVRVDELSSLFAVSEVTIRNDLAILEKSGQLERVSGGAVQTMKNYYNLDYQQRKSKHAAYKQAIAAAAADLINDGETLMINSGTTAYFTSVELKKRKNLSILTNSIAVATELGDYPSFRVILLGGEINPQYSFTYGSEAVNSLRKYKSDKCIISVDGICSTSGLTTYHAQEAEVCRLMIERSAHKIIVADASKFGHESFYNICDISEIDTWITNKIPLVGKINEIQDKGVKIIQC
ncbi:MAG: DeoR/GlpR family DNA-binding transcription regulator [Eubacteriales bacterium]|nr:DeoR/GlpR family DNA-binding transcription regulator [Eubacteriales bacterium]